MFTSLMLITRLMIYWLFYNNCLTFLVMFLMECYLSTLNRLYFNSIVFFKNFETMFAPCHKILKQCSRNKAVLWYTLKTISTIFDNCIWYFFYSVRYCLLHVHSQAVNHFYRPNTTFKLRT